MNSLVNKIQRWVALRTLRNPLALKGGSGVVSFSFDDAPESACTAGKVILEKHGCQGTWYVAGGLTGQYEQGRVCHSIPSLQNLVRDGHHIGCHTYSHTPCNQLSRHAMVQELERNARFLDEVGVPAEGRHFSFPLGAFDVASKRLASYQFQSCRITGGGIQVGVADLNALRSERLYQHVITPARLKALVDEVALKKGWLIFYTHAVDNPPGFWGCTPQLLDYAVEAALDAGCKVLPVDQAVRYWRTG